MEEWQSLANKDGFLDWEGFSSGLSKALQADAPRLQKMAAASSKAPPTQVERMMKSLQEGHKGRGLGHRLLARPVKEREIEAFLGQCEGKSLVQALAHVKKEVYRCQLRLQQLAAEAELELARGASKETSSGGEHAWWLH